MVSQIKETSFQNPVLQIANDFDTDLFFFSNRIDLSNTHGLINYINAIEHRRKNVGLLLTTGGGDPNSAFRFARFLKRKYDQVTLYVFGICKSAGTLLALAADKIVMSDFGELGPLDIQSIKEEDVRRESVLTTQQAVKSVAKQVSVMFTSCLREILKADGDETGESYGNISLKTAEDIASSIAIGLFEPIAGKLEPIRMGKLERDMQIAYDYGSLLNQAMAENGSLYKLITGYPSHEFVIDYEEAKTLFHCVATPTELEQALERFLLEQNLPVRWQDNTICDLTAAFASPENPNPLKSLDNLPGNGHSPTDDSSDSNSEAVEQVAGVP